MAHAASPAEVAGGGRHCWRGGSGGRRGGSGGRRARAPLAASAASGQAPATWGKRREDVGRRRRRENVGMEGSRASEIRETSGKRSGLHFAAAPSHCAAGGSAGGQG
eukprot:gene17787-biopygen7688